MKGKEVHYIILNNLNRDFLYTTPQKMSPVGSSGLTSMIGTTRRAPSPYETKQQRLERVENSSGYKQSPSSNLCRLTQDLVSGSAPHRVPTLRTVLEGPEERHIVFKEWVEALKLLHSQLIERNSFILRQFNGCTWGIRINKAVHTQIMSQAMQLTITEKDLKQEERGRACAPAT